MCLKTLLGVWKICSLKSSFVKNLLQIHDTSWIHFFFLMYTAFIWYALCSHQMLSFYTRSILKFLLDPPSYKKFPYKTWLILGRFLSIFQKLYCKYSREIFRKCSLISVNEKSAKFPGIGKEDSRKFNLIWPLKTQLELYGTSSNE